MVSKKLAIEVLNAALSTGGDFAEIFLDSQERKTITVENGLVENVNREAISGVGLRILQGLKSVYGHTNDVSRKSLLELASNLSKSFNGERTIKVSDLVNQKIKKVNKRVESFKDVSDDDIVALLKDANNIIKSHDERIVRVSTIFLVKYQDVTIMNSNEKMFKTHREYGRLVLQSVASENGKIETRFDGPGCQKGFSWFKNELGYQELAKNHAEKLILMLGAKECPSGKFPCIIGNGWGGVIFHEACGHQMEATSVAKHLSVYSDLFNEKIGSDIVNAYDDGTMPNEWGSNDIDDEGVPTKKNLLIEHGVLKGYLVDPFNTRRMPGFETNGCSRRQSYKFEPTSRMSNTYIANGKSTREEIIKNTKLAIYAVSFAGGSVDPSTGEFQFGCSEAYLVRDGKIVMPLRGATLIGKATEVLKHIDMVANDLDLGQGMCGSQSGSLEVNVGQPTIRVDEIVVGGRGGSIDEL